MLLRIVQFLFGCGHYSVCHMPGVATIGIEQCQLRWFHRGPHRFPAPWVEGF